MTKTNSLPLSLTQLAWALEEELSFAPPSQAAQEHFAANEVTNADSNEAELSFLVPSPDSLERQQELLSWLTNLGNRLPPYQETEAG